MVKHQYFRQYNMTLKWQNELLIVFMWIYMKQKTLGHYLLQNPTNKLEDNSINANKNWRSYSQLEQNCAMKG